LAEDAKNWAYGDKGKGLHDEESAAWCIKALEVFGWVPMDPAMVELDKELTEMTRKRNNLLKVISDQIDAIKSLPMSQAVVAGTPGVLQILTKKIQDLEEILAQNS
jgi:hypothetical protein